jgi:hypothetical protein
MMTPHQTLLGMMSSGATYKTMTSAEEKIHIIIRQTGESVESEVVNGQRNGSRES